MLKSTIFQSIIFSFTIHLIMRLSNIKLLLNLIQTKPTDDFSFQDSYFITYNGIFENYPIIATVFWLTITFIVIAIIYIIGKWIFIKFIYNLFN